MHSAGSSIDLITEGGILEALGERPLCWVRRLRMFKTAIKDVAEMHQAMCVAENIHDVNVSVVDSISKNGWRKYACLVV